MSWSDQIPPDAIFCAHCGNEANDLVRLDDCRPGGCLVCEKCAEPEDDDE